MFEKATLHERCKKYEAMLKEKDEIIKDLKT